MTKPLIIANWKMNPQSLAEAKRNFEIIKKGVRHVKNVETVVCAPFVFLAALKATKDVKLGAQDCFWEKKGPFTGEISPKMIKNLGCKYVILGHSERRKYLKEETELVNRKIKAALKVGLRVIFCVSSEKKEPGREMKYQLEKGLYGLNKSVFVKLILVYEPIWAISTTKNRVIATPQESSRGCLYIRKVLERLFNKRTAQRTKIIYGGSVDSKNVRDFLDRGEMAGGLVGAASLKPKEFVKTVKNASRS